MKRAELAARMGGRILESVLSYTKEITPGEG